MRCYAMLCDAMRCYAMLCDAMLCYAMRCYAMLCYAMLCYAMLCYAMLCYAMLCYAMCSGPALWLLSLRCLGVSVVTSSWPGFRHRPKWSLGSGSSYPKNPRLRYRGSASESACLAAFKTLGCFLWRCFLLLCLPGSLHIGCLTFLGSPDCGCASSSSSLFRVRPPVRLSWFRTVSSGFSGQGRVLRQGRFWPLAGSWV